MGGASGFHVLENGTYLFDYDVENRMQTQSLVDSITVLVRSNAFASSFKQPGNASTYHLDHLKDNITADSSAPGDVWASEITNTTHTGTVEMATEKTLREVVVYVPSDKGLPNQFRLKYRTENQSGQVVWKDLPVEEVTGAQPVGGGDYEATGREMTFKVEFVDTDAVRYVQLAGGGSDANPDQAWVNGFETKGETTAHLQKRLLEGVNQSRSTGRPGR